MSAAAPVVYSRNTTINARLSPGTGTNIVRIYSPAPSPYEKAGALRFYGYLQTLRLRSSLYSLPETDIPNIPDAASRAERVQAVRDLEWRSPHKRLDILLSTRSSGWNTLISVSLLARHPYSAIDLMPYLVSEGDFLLGADTHLGVRMYDDGYGLLDGIDEVVLFGCVLEQAFLLDRDDMPARFSAYSQPIDIDTAGDHTIATVAADKAIKLVRLLLNPDDSVGVQVKSGEQIVVDLGQIDGGVAVDYDPTALNLGTGKPLVINLSAAVRVRGAAQLYA